MGGSAHPQCTYYLLPYSDLGKLRVFRYLTSHISMEVSCVFQPDDKPAGEVCPGGPHTSSLAAGRLLPGQVLQGWEMVPCQNTQHPCRKYPWGWLLLIVCLRPSMLGSALLLLWHVAVARGLDNGNAAFIAILDMARPGWSVNPSCLLHGFIYHSMSAFSHLMDCFRTALEPLPVMVFSLNVYFVFPFFYRWSW